MVSKNLREEQNAAVIQQKDYPDEDTKDGSKGGSTIVRNLVRRISGRGMAMTRRLSWHSRSNCNLNAQDSNDEKLIRKNSSRSFFSNSSGHAAYQLDSDSDLDISDSDAFFEMPSVVANGENIQEQLITEDAEKRVMENLSRSSSHRAFERSLSGPKLVPEEESTLDAPVKLEVDKLTPCLTINDEGAEEYMQLNIVQQQEELFPLP